MVSRLHVKLLRDLKQMGGQVVTIALVVAAGVAAFVTMRSTWTSISASKTAYYERQRFADIFARLESAPEAVAERIAELPGVARVETRLVERVTLPLEGLAEPALGDIVSLPTFGAPLLNDVVVTAGRRPLHANEVLLLETFAEAHDLSPGDEFPAVINGALRHLQLVGTALSPEYVFAMLPGEMSVDPGRFAVVWMAREELAPAFRRVGAFNSLLVQLQPAADPVPLLAQLDQALRPYGGLGAVPRARQISNFTLEGELSQLGVLAMALPAIFLGVAAFLLNVVLARMIRLQRPQIATLAALGYRGREIAVHYLQLAIGIVLLGSFVGLSLGALGGQAFTAYYGKFFKFPVLAFRLEPGLVGMSLLISCGAALVGSSFSLRDVMRMPPAEAMRPPAPANYRRSSLERMGIYALLGPASRMVMREVSRKPWRTLISALGISLAVGILVVARSWADAMDFLIDVQFHRAMRQDVTVTFLGAHPERAVRSLESIRGVFRAEAQRSVPTRFIHRSAHRDAAVIGYAADHSLTRVIDRDGNEVEVPEHGIALTAKLAEILDLDLGEEVTLEFLEGQRRTVRVPVVTLVEEAFGLSGHMQSQELHRYLREQMSANAALLEIDPTQYPAIRERLLEHPQVVTVSRRGNLRQQFEEQSGAMMAVFTFVASLFAVIIAVAVVYNNARIALSQRERDLASLRVLGFTRAEVSRVLLGELSIQVILSIPLGLWIGKRMAVGMMNSADPETYRIPVLISAGSYSFATVVALAAGLLSALIVRRKLDHLDLIGVLKTRQ